MIEELAIQTITFIAFLGFTAKRMMNYLHALQQEDYDNARLSTWIIKNKVFDSRVSQFLIVITGIVLFTELPPSILHVIVFLGFVFAAYFEKDARKDSKKGLVLTKRATRILIAGLIFSAASATIAFYISFPAIWILCVHLIPLCLILGNASLAPYESMVQNQFYKEAQSKLKDINPKVIAITGSYGKTSTKHILGHILKAYAPTLTTPGSVNTVMGVARIIREDMTANHKFFITEMGAYGPGSISRLCEFTPPDYGIITSIGHAHYERFKSLDTVAQAKYELAESVISRGGTMVVHEKTLKYEHSRNIRNQNMSRFIACGEPMREYRKPKTEQEYSYLTPDDLHIKSVKQTPKGICVEIDWKGEHYTLRAPLFGTHHGHNIALAFACARTLGMDAKDIKTALASLPQIRHRLEVKEMPDKSIIIDDAYNSNPPGFRAALHVLGVLARDQKETKGRGRAILITPGIVELGAAHAETHRTLGRLAADICDIVVVVNPKRIPSFIEGFYEKKSNILKEFKSFQEAQKWVVSNKQDGDVVLIENDLPDIYEGVLKI